MKYLLTHRPVLPVEDSAGEEGAPAPERQHVLRQVRVEVGPLAPQLELGRRALHPPPPPPFLLHILFGAAQSAVAPPLPTSHFHGARGGLGPGGLLLGVATGEGWKEKEGRDAYLRKHKEQTSTWYRGMWNMVTYGVESRTHCEDDAYI